MAILLALAPRTHNDIESNTAPETDGSLSQRVAPRLLLNLAKINKNPRSIWNDDQNGSRGEIFGSMRQRIHVGLTFFVTHEIKIAFERFLHCIDGRNHMIPRGPSNLRGTEFLSR